MGLLELFSSKIKISETAQEATGLGAIVGGVVTYALANVATAAAFATPIGAGVGLLVGAGIYLLKKHQEAALSAIKKDGLTPKGAPIANGQVAKQQIQNAIQKSATKEK